MLNLDCKIVILQPIHPFYTLYSFLVDFASLLKEKFCKSNNAIDVGKMIFYLKRKIYYDILGNC